jgi:hypothetical protein
MYAWKLPTFLRVGGRNYKIRTDYRAILDILAAMNDPDILEPDMSGEEINAERIMTMLQILYIDFESMPTSDWNEAAEKAKEFIDCGIKDDGAHKPRLIDWEQDAPIIVPAINKVCGKDVRSVKYMHWWTFLGYYMEIGECTLATIVSIRDKKRRGKKLEKWEQEYYRNNKKLIDLKTEKVERSEEEKEELRKLFGLK